jgi:pimeloyl-ACP methyl ester carboxylesterase
VSPDLSPPLTIDLDGPVAYRAWDGPAETTFVMVHGLGGAGVNWVRVASGLSGLGRVLTLDLPGFGDSPRAGRGSGLMDLRRTLSHFLAELGTGRVVLCGSSMGGALTLLQAAVEPTSVDGIVLTGSVFPWTGGGLPHPAVIASFAGYRLPYLGDRLVAMRMRAMTPEQAVRLGFRFVVADPAAIPDDVVRLHVELMRERQRDPDAIPAFTEAARSMLRLGENREALRRALDHAPDDVLVLHGRRDRLVPVAFAEAELLRHPTWRGRIFPDLGHAPMLEAPGRWLAEVADWHAERFR